MKIVSSNIQPSSTEEEAMAVKVTKTNSLTLQASTHVEHRNDNEVDLDSTVDERDSTTSSVVSFDNETAETAATVATNLGGGCGLFGQMSNRFKDDRSHRSDPSIISDMVDDIEQELHNRFFASHDDEEEDGDESSVDTDTDMLNKSNSDMDTVEDDDDEQEDTVDDDGQDITVDSMPSASSTTVSSKTSTRSKTSTLQGSKSLDTTGLSEVDDDDGDGDSTTIDTDQSHSLADDSHATAKMDDNGTSWFGGLFSSTPSGNNQEETSVDQEEAAKYVVEEEANEEDTLPAVTAEEETESQTKSGGSWFGEFFSNTNSPADEPVASVDKEESPMEEKDESNQEEVAKSVGEVEKPVQDEEKRSSKDILSSIQEVSALVAEVLNLPLTLVDGEKSTTDHEEEKKSSVVQEEETAAVKDIFVVASSSTMGSRHDLPMAMDDSKAHSSNTVLKTKSSGTADNHKPSSFEKKVSKQKKRSWRKIASKKIRSILHPKTTAQLKE